MDHSVVKWYDLRDKQGISRSDSTTPAVKILSQIASIFESPVEQTFGFGISISFQAYSQTLFRFDALIDQK